MNRSILMAALVAAVGLAACDKPTVVNVPPTPVAVPGPAGTPGAPGTPGTPGSPGETGRPGDSPVIVIQPASVPSN